MSSSIARKLVQFFRAHAPVRRRIGIPFPARTGSVALLAEGYVNKEIADRLAISAPTVATYIRRIYEKLHVHSRAAAIGKFSSLTREIRPGLEKATIKKAVSA